MKDFLRISDLSPRDFALLLDLAAEIKAEPSRHADLLRGDLVAVYFAKPSTRTRFSFEAAIHRLGGSAVTVGTSDLQLGRGETIEDTARTLSHFARAFVVRTFADSDVARFAAAATIPVINALTDGHHPCQALADFLTLRERLGTFAGRKLAYVGDGNNVCHSLMEAAGLAGMDIAVATPPDYEPDRAVAETARRLATSSGARIHVTNDPRAALEDAVAVYTDTWMSMGVPESERAARMEVFMPYQVNELLLSHARPGAIFMHCLPAHRGEEVTADVIDGPRSVVFEQVENRGHTEQAVLLALLERRLMGSEQP
jgi:ornithine carbamoyltransferase